MKGLDRAVIMSKRTIYAYWPYMAKEGRGYTQVFIKRVNSTGQTTTLFGGVLKTGYFINDVTR